MIFVKLAEYKIPAISRNFCLFIGYQTFFFSIISATA